jgi:type VI secretion system protein ImpA
LYEPIAGDNPAGADLRYTPVYERIKEARREEDDLNQGVWKRERKVADYCAVITLAQEAIATGSKDLQLAAWLCHALVATEGAAGLVDGLACCRELVTRYGRTLFPRAEDDDVEAQVAPLEWLGSCLDQTVKRLALNSAGHNWFQFRESRALGYDEQAKEPSQKKNREKAIKEGKLTPEEFDKGLLATPKKFYVDNQRAIDRALEEISAVDASCRNCFADAAPGFGRLTAGLTDVGHVVHQLLEKKRETDPDPPAPELEPEPALPVIESEPAIPDIPGPAQLINAVAYVEPGIDAVAQFGAILRKRDPINPAPYLMLRGLRWGELRKAAANHDGLALEAPPTEVRREIKALSFERRWCDLLERAEIAMGFPYSRAWLDLQRFVVEACAALGTEYDLIAQGIRSELRALLRDIPELMTATLMDDTPTANQETQKWLQEIVDEPMPPAAGAAPKCCSKAFTSQFVDPYTLATAAVKSGKEQQAFEIMRDEISQQRSGRGRFFRRLQLVELCISANKQAIAQPILEELLATADAHKIEEWEEREVVAEALATMLSASKRLQGDAKEKQKYFERICRLDPVKALATQV